jgi:hypothetical protein
LSVMPEYDLMKIQPEPEGHIQETDEEAAIQG